MDNTTNSDYLPENGPSSDHLPFANPIIEKCVFTSMKIIDRDTGEFLRDEHGDDRMFGKVMVKNGLTSTFDDVYGLFCMGGGGGTNGTTNTANDDEIDEYSDSDVEEDIDSDGSTTDEDEEDEDIDTDVPSPTQQLERAYLYEPCENGHICRALYGNVFLCKVLRRQNSDADWQTTGEKCAIKAMPWDRIRDGLVVRRRLENPRTEIAAMSHLKAVYDSTAGDGNARSAREVMREINVVVPLDFLYDDRFLYSIMPFCDGGELFDVQNRENFSEEMCRTLIIPQILNGLRWLQTSRLCHRDISLENFVLDGEGEERRVIMIDLGMTVQIPYGEDGNRQLISSQSSCGKISYISPEIFQQEPFDGHAVDLWAVAVILFCLITGRHPWEHQQKDYGPNVGPNVLNNMYRHMTGGYLVAIVRNTEDVDISENAMFLLQSMLRADPRFRLCLEQILAHRWLNEMN